MYLYHWREEPVIARLKARRDGRTLDFTLKTGEKMSADMSGVMERHDPLGPLADPDVFASAEIIADGDGVKFGHQDRMIGADTLVRIAEEQRPFRGRDLAAWRRRMKITADEAGALLGYSGRHIRNLEKTAGPLPVCAAVAVRAMTADPAIYAAHHRPKRPWRAEMKPAADEKTGTKAGGKAKATGRAKTNGKAKAKADGKTKAADGKARTRARAQKTRAQNLHAPGASA